MVIDSFAIDGGVISILKCTTTRGVVKNISYVILNMFQDLAMLEIVEISRNLINADDARQIPDRGPG
jgi:hypothetical protein